MVSRNGAVPGPARRHRPAAGKGPSESSSGSRPVTLTLSRRKRAGDPVLALADAARETLHLGDLVEIMLRKGDGRIMLGWPCRNSAGLEPYARLAVQPSFVRSFRW
jgi:hypothetical protein